MKKFILLSLLVASFSIGAWANTKPIFHCDFKLNDGSRVFKNVEILLDVATVVPAPLIGNWEGTWTVACDICKAVPRTFPLAGTSTKIDSRFDGTFENSPLHLSIPLETFAPTADHWSKLTYPTINGGQPVDGICTDLRVAQP